MSAMPELVGELDALRRRLAEAEQTIQALLRGEIDTISAGPRSSPVLLQEAQEALRQSESMLRAIFEGSLEPMLVADDEGRYVDANPAACELLGLSRAELLGRSAREFVEPGFDFDPAWEAFLAAGLMRGEHVLLRPDGTRRVTEFSATARVRPGRHLSILRDVTDRRREEEARRLAEERLRAVAHSAPLVLFAYDREGTFTLCEGRGLSDAGARPGELLGRSALEILRDMTLREEAGGCLTLPELLERVLAGEEVAIAAEAFGRSWECWYAPQRDGRGAIIGVHGVGVDVTDRQRAEAARREAEGRLRAVLEHAPIVVYAVDRQGSFTLSQGYGLARRTALGRPEVVGRSAWDLYGDLEARDASGQVLRGREVLERVFAGESLQVTTEVEGVWYDNWVVPQRDPGGEVSGLVGVALDVTDQKQTERALQASEGRLRSLLEVDIIAVATWSADGQILDANRAYLDLIGFGRQDLEDGRIRWPDRVPSDGDEPVRLALEQMRATGRCLPFEIDYLRRDGSRVPVLVGAAMLPGSHELGVAFFLDLTERRAAQAALRRSEERARRLVDSNLIGVASWSRDGWIVEANDAYLTLHGFTRADLEAGRVRWEGLTPPDQRAVIERSAAALRAVGRSGPDEVEILLPDGTRRPILFGATALDPAAEEGMAFVLDLSERREAERLLRETTEMLEALVRASPAAIAVLDLDCTVRLWNPAAERLFGWSAAEVVGATIPLVGPELEDLRRLVSEGASLSGRREQRTRRDGSRAQVAVWRAPLRSVDGAIVGSVGMLADVSEQARLEEQLQQAQKMEAIGNLAGGIAHDFNNVLAAITGFASLALDELSSHDPVHEHVGQVLKAAGRASGLVKQLLALGRKSALQPQVLDPNALVEELQRMLRRVIRADVVLQTRLMAGVGCVLADPGQLEQVLMNLVLNARDAMPRGGTLSIETGELLLTTEAARRRPGVAPGRYVFVAVRDSGVGMASDVLERIFEPFFTTKPQGEGTGLGLPTVYGIVKQSGGFIDVDSAPGRGSCFAVFLPRAEGRPQPLTDRIARAGLRRGHETVLLVEDDELVRELAAHVLGRSGYRVLEASNGGEALLLCEQHPGQIDLMLTDVVLPRMSGPELARRIAMGGCRGARVLYMSGYAEGSGVPEGEPFLPKPFSPDDLVRRVRETLDRPLRPGVVP